MRRNRRRVTRNAAVWLTVLVCMLALVTILSQPARTAEDSRGQIQMRRTPGAGNPLIRLGEFPPDFELPKLTFRTDATGNTIGVISEKDAVRLSSFRGKKPVCLIMSSYT